MAHPNPSQWNSLQPVVCSPKPAVHSTLSTINILQSISPLYSTRCCASDVSVDQRLPQIHLYVSEQTAAQIVVSY